MLSKVASKERLMSAGDPARISLVNRNLTVARVRRDSDTGIR